MIRVGILGADSPMAGELIRILVHHPEVELSAAIAPAAKGRLVSDHHRGLVGDTVLRFSDDLSLRDLDILFITSVDIQLPPDTVWPPDLKVVLIQEDDSFEAKPPLDSFDYVPGVSEMYRKPLVRGAMASRILPAATSLSLIVLFPLALHLLLNDTVSIKVFLPSFRLEKVDTDFMKSELESQLRKVQLSMGDIREITVSPSSTLRALSLEVSFRCGVSIEEIKKLYENTYDDHNFTFIVGSEPSVHEVAGTHKCLIYINKAANDEVTVKAVADSVLRGGAGDAVHAMNLLFGLFEKIGLSFPAGLAY